uniref:ABC-2 type transporter transmembrane domain-containing protein n=1 Tax=Panagrolaimus sp. JU765 TaxID=591449 RepID=A0AC34QF41_9BILA
MRDPVVLHVRVFQTVVIALTMGAIYFDTQISQRTVMNVNGALFQVIMNMNFMFQFTTVHMFCDELPTFLREHQANLYRVFPYFLAKNLAEAI